MHMPLCSRCHKNVAVVFISKMEEGSASNEGYCLKCARELGLKPIDGLMRQMGITDDDLDQITNEMTNMHALANTESEDYDDEDNEYDDEVSAQQEADDAFDFGRTHTFPFLEKMFSQNGDPSTGSAAQNGSAAETEEDRRRALLEEYTDVIHCALVLDLEMDLDQIRKKTERWMRRLGIGEEDGN